jgi:hypothetical protein
VFCLLRLSLKLARLKAADTNSTSAAEGQFFAEAIAKSAGEGYTEGA